MAKSILSIILKTVKEGGADKETIFALKELQKNIGTATAVAGAMAGAYAVVDQVLGESVRATVAYADEVRKMSQLTGQSAEESSKVIQVMDDYKVSTDTLTAATKTLAKQGLTLNIQTLGKLSDEYRKLGSGSERTAFLVEKFGKSGLGMAEAMEKGSSAILAASDAIDGNLIMTQRGLDAAREYQAQVDNLSDAWDSLKVGLGTNVLPVLNTLLGAINNHIDAGWKWYNSFPIVALIDGFNDLRNASTDQVTETDSATRSYIAMGESMQLLIDEKIPELEENYKGLLDMTMSLAGASDEATAKIVYNNLLQKLSVDGITSAEYAMAQSAGVALGIFDQKTADTATKINELTDAVVDGRLAAEDLGLAVSNIDSEKRVDIMVSVRGDGAAYLLAQNIKPKVVNGEIVAPYRDSGGPGVAGKPYIISPSAGPEMFIPESNGTFVPNVDEVLGGSSQTIVVNFYNQPVMSLSAQADAANAARPIVEEIVRRMR